MGNSASALPYTIGKQVSTVNDGWALHEGSQKSDSATVTVFVAKKPALSKTPLDRRNPSITQLDTALHHFQNCKKLRHPHILKVFATLDTDNPNDASHGGTPSAATSASSASATVTTGDLIIVTEPCIPLDSWLQTAPSSEQIAWGLESIVRALHFLHTSASLVHGNVSPSSFYVTPAGDVKLQDFSLVTAIHPDQGGVPRHFRDCEAMITPGPYRSPERQEGQWDVIAANGIHAMDSYSLGVLMGHFYNGRLPPQFTKAVQRLLTANVKMRPKVQPLLKCPVFATPYQKLQLQVEELSVQPVEQKVVFWQNLASQLEAGIVPESVGVYKLLPLMKSSIETICNTESLRTQSLYRREVLSILQPLFYVAANFLDENFGKELTGIIGLLFGVNDRGVRGALLQKATLFAKYMDKNALNQAVFEPMCSGFSDSSAALRELTLKATLVLVPYLFQPNLEKLSRYLVRLQSDPEASIRTNTVIFFSKLAPYLTDTTRQKLLLPAFTRALKDNFKPCRLAALQSTLKAKEYFDPRGVAANVLPVVTPQLLDPAKEVRKEAFAVVDELLFFLRQESERMNALPEYEQGMAASNHSGAAPKSGPPVPAGNHKPPTQEKKTPAPSSGGYLSGMTSWMSTSTKPADSGQAATGTPVATAPTTAPLPPGSLAPAASMNMMSITPAASTNMIAIDDDDDLMDDGGDGWDDDDLDLDSGGAKTDSAGGGASSLGGSLLGPPQASASLEEDFFGSFEAKPMKSASLRPGSSGKLTMPAKKTKAAISVTKLAVEPDAEDGWDDF